MSSFERCHFCHSEHSQTEYIGLNHYSIVCNVCEREHGYEAKGRTLDEVRGVWNEDQKRAAEEGQCNHCCDCGRAVNDGSQYKTCTECRGWWR